MSKEKQIEEMAEIICQNTECDTTWNEVYGSANALYNAGYRKASEVAKEVLDELERRLYPVSHHVTSIVVDIDEIAYAVIALKKKYTESEKDDG